MRYRGIWLFAVFGFARAQTMLFFSIYVIMPFATATGVYSNEHNECERGHAPTGCGSARKRVATCFSFWSLRI